VAVLAMLPSSPVSLAAEDPVAAAELAAKAGAATPEGKKFQDALEQPFAREHAGTIQRCARETKRPELTDFHLLLRVDGAGVVDQALVKPSTNVAVCVQKSMVGWKTPPPPHAGFWLDIGVRLARK